MPDTSRAAETAVIGMAGRLPGSPDLDAFWRHLAAGDDLISETPAERWDWRALGRAHGERTGRAARWGGYLDDVDRFDAAFFGISPREAELMDPQQRLVLEAVWTALEDAGLRPSALAGTRVGVFIGVSGVEYAQLQRDGGRHLEGHAGTGVAQSLVPNRVSYFFDFRGPSVAVDTACSSSLTAVAQAAAALRTGACDLAVAGGVNLLLSPEVYPAMADGRMLSEDGRCKTFDSGADGYVRGEGVGVVVLRDRAEAERARRRRARRAQGDRDQPRRAQLVADRTQHRGAERPAGGRLHRRRCRPRRGGLPGGARHGHRTGRPRRGVGHARGVRGARPAARRTAARRAVLRHRLRQVEHRPPGDRGGHGRAVQGRAGHAARTAPRQPALHGAQPVSGAGGRAVPGARRTDTVAAAGRAAADRRAQLVRRGRRQRASRPPGTGRAPRTGTRDRRTAGLPAVGAHTGGAALAGRARARARAAYLERPDAAHVRLLDVAHTLLTGREEMAERAVAVAGDRAELIGTLRALADGEERAGLVRGRARKRGRRAAAAVPAAPSDPAAGTLLDRARRWVEAGPADLTCAEGGQRVPLPTYPFERVRHWASARGSRAGDAASRTAAPDPAGHGGLHRGRPGGLREAPAAGRLLSRRPPGRGRARAARRRPPGAGPAGGRTLRPGASARRRWPGVGQPRAPGAGRTAAAGPAGGERRARSGGAVRGRLHRRPERRRERRRERGRGGPRHGAARRRRAALRCPGGTAGAGWT
ncbi:polyketide synthase [Streptomyces sp. GKU 257-1]|nr:polyketide synthase [Streptomyces sp. GKU 257-1]